MKKPKLKAALICEAATIDQQNRAVIYGVFDQVQAKEVPVTHPTFCVFCIWEGGEGVEYTGGIKVVAPSGKILAQVTQAKFKIGQRQARVITNFNMMRFSEWGKYKIQILINDEKVEELNLEIKKIAEG